MRNNMTDNNIQSVERTIAVIRVLCDNYEGISLTQLSAQVDLHKATTSRILKTLKSMNLVHQNSNTHMYSMGTGFLELALKYLGNFSLRKVALPYMRHLQKIVGETVNLAVIDEDEIIYIERVDSKQALRHSMNIGSRTPAYRTSLGKAIWAFTDRDQVRKMLERKPLEKTTSYTKTDVEEILQELDIIKQQRIAVDDREHQDHICCLGAPIFSAENKVLGALSVSGPCVRIKGETLEAYKKELKKTVEDISIELGWRY